MRIKWPMALLPSLGAFLVATTTSSAQDITAETMGMIYDLASPAAVAQGLGGQPVPPDVQRAQAALGRDQLIGASHISQPPAPSGVLQRWGIATKMGANAPYFANEIGAVRDAAMQGDPTAIEQAIDVLYDKGRRGQPTADDLREISRNIGSLVAGEPEESVRNTIKNADNTVEIVNERRAGQASVEVTQAGVDGQQVRTVFRGQEQTRVTADGKDLVVTTVPTGVCSISQQESDAARAALNGQWKGSDGNAWSIEGDAASFAAVETRSDGRKLRYTGTYTLGKAVAFYGVQSVDDMEPNLPVDVRSQLVTWSPKVGFTVRLDLCGVDTSHLTALKGTWSSRHVTYGGIDHKISTVHDPYDVRLTLTRELNLKMARGGRFPEDGP